ncbi:DUF6531 domain-containing protein [Streptomyces mobaraensis]|uniref:DUF6531 domain-containing protein n=1 Tax=Streptomyces mobaraensis TaxID=35621 RepID=UPI000996B0C7
MGVVLPGKLALALDLIGVNWPNVDEDDYRDMARSLRSFASDVDAGRGNANVALNRLLSTNRGAMTEAIEAHVKKLNAKHLHNLAEGGRLLAGGLDAAAAVVAGAKGAAIIQLGLLASEIAAAQAAAPITLGFSELGALGGVAATRTAVKRILKEAAEAAAQEVLSIVTGPVFAALDAMTTDLVVQVVSDGLGAQDGIHLGQTLQAGKDNLRIASASGTSGLVLAGASGGGPGGDLVFDEHEHNTFTSKVHEHSMHLGEKGGKRLHVTRSHFNRTRGRGSLAKVIEEVTERAMSSLDKAQNELTKHLGDVGKGLAQAGRAQKKQDQHERDKFRHTKSKDFGSAPHTSGGTGPASGIKPDPLRHAKGDARRHSIPLDKKTCVTDPVDVGTGELVLAQTDLSLPGVLPLILRRTHLSKYRFGHWFGRSWASTFDERLEVDTADGSALWARDDGSILIYPRLPRIAEETILPSEGTRLRLTQDAHNGPDTTYRISDPDSGISRFFTYSPYGGSSSYWLTGVEDRNGNRIEFGRQPDGTPIDVLHSGGYQVQLITTSGRIRRLSVRTADGSATVSSYGYDGAGNLETVINSSQTPLRFTYDVESRITSWTDRNNSTYRYIYDADGRVARTVGPDGFLSATFEYEREGSSNPLVTRYTNSLGATTSFHLNSRHQIVSVIDPLGRSTHADYDTSNRLLSSTDPLGRTTQVVYDESGRPIELIRPDGHRSTVTYDNQGLPESFTGPDGATWLHSYDDRGNRTAVTNPAGETTTYSFDARGAIASVTDPLGQTVRITNSPAGQPLTLTDPSGSVTHCQYDAFGRTISITNPVGGKTTLTWSVEGLLTSRTNPDGGTEHWEYDGEGNCTSYTDPLGRTTAYEYTHFDLPLSRITADGVRYTFTHDTERRLTQIMGPDGLAWDYFYDSAGQLVSETDFDGRTLSYGYDAAGNLTSRTNAEDQTTTYCYDSVDNLLEKTVEGQVYRYEHDPCGRLLRASGPNSLLAYTYDEIGRVVGQSINGRMLTTTCDSAGRRTRRVTPAGVVTTYAYDAAGHPVSLTSAGRTLNFEHDAIGRENTRYLAGAFALKHVWGPAGQLIEQSLDTPSSPQPVLHRNFTYRPDGRLTSIADRLTGRRTFTLDASGRVAAVDAAGWQERYAYDELGNQTYAAWPDTHPSAAARGQRAYSGTRINRAGRVRYEHDREGRVVIRQKIRLSRKPDTWKYTWDAEDRLIGVVTPDGIQWRYHYDPLGRRISKQRLAADGETVLEETRFTWDGSSLAEQTTSASRAHEDLTLTWDQMGTMPLTQVETKSLANAPQKIIDQRFFAMVADQIGTPTELVDESGDIAWRARSTLWGSTVWNRDASAHTPIRFPGQYFDAETQLHHNYFRYYDPETARYLSLDPLGLAPAPNPATYVDNPHTLSDPLGLAPCDENDVTWGGRVRYGALGPGRRATSVHATIEPDMTGGTTRPYLRPEIAGWQSGRGYNRTHLLGAQIGGSNRDHRNFVTMHRQANAPVMLAIESQVRAAVDRGETIEYSVTPLYRTNDPSDTIPIALHITARGNRGFQFHPYGSDSGGVNEVTILNVPKRKP